MDTAALPYNHEYAGIGQAKAPIETESSDKNVTDGEHGGFWGDDGFSFGDLLDLINPLQHLPIVSTLYRAITNDEIAPGPRMAGGAIYGGPLGFVSALADTFIEEATGKDVGEHIVALAGFGPDEAETDAPSTGETVQTAALTGGSPALPQATVSDAPAAGIPLTAAAAVVAAAPIQSASTAATHTARPAALAKYQNAVLGGIAGGTTIGWFGRSATSATATDTCECPQPARKSDWQHQLQFSHWIVK